LLKPLYEQEAEGVMLGQQRELEKQADKIKPKTGVRCGLLIAARKTSVLGMLLPFGLWGRI